MIRHNVETRIIIDCDAHNRFMPNYAVYFSALGRSKDSTLLRLGEESHDNEDEDEEVSDSEDYFDDAEDVFSTGSNSNDACKPKHRPLTTEELLLCVPYVRGYAIKTKKWLWFYVDQIAPIKFADNAFSSLVLPSEQKSLIRAFVESQVKYKDDFDDVIAGKGRGMYVDYPTRLLLSNPPACSEVTCRCSRHPPPSCWKGSVNIFQPREVLKPIT